MCGINGIIKYDNSINAEQSVKRMNQALSHRGPDREGFKSCAGIALGHRRLSIIDLSNEAAQPMSDNSGRYTMVCNGELYNYNSLKAQLKNYQFKSLSDNEVILAAYVEWGRECLNKFEGMYAFAIWDRQDNSIFLARDRMGVKPLYWFQSDEAFVFSSEIKALLASGIPKRTINRKAVYDYLRYQTVHAPDTIVEDVKMLMPGHCMTIVGNKLEITEYWHLPQQISYSEKTYEQVKSEVKELIYQAVEKRMIADVPLGAFLSGGIDSGIITAVMSELSSKPVNTFSVTFAEPEFSEAKYARIIAQKYNTSHTEILLKPKDFLHKLPEALSYMDHPSGDGANSYILSKATKEAGITVALSGLGGDELFAGYEVFKQMHRLLIGNILRKTPAFIRKPVGKVLSNVKKDVRSQKLSEILNAKRLDFQNVYPVFRLLFTEKQLISFVQEKQLSQNAVYDQLTEVVLEKNGIFSAVSQAEIGSYMQNVLLRDTDQMSMASALEVRVPFLDHKLVEYVLQLPDKYKYPHSPKKLLVEALNLLPENVINRPKMGFLLPWEHWLKNELRDFAETRLQSIAKRPFFNEKKLLKLWSDFTQGNSNTSWARLWIFIVLEDYIQKMNLIF